MGFFTGPLSSDKAQGQTAHVIVFKEKDSSLKIANGENELVTKKVGFFLELVLPAISICTFLNKTIEIF